MKMSLRQYCIEHGRDTLLREWDAEKNGGLTPSDVSFGSHQKVWWQCSKGHSWQAKVYSRSEGSGCPYCTGRKETPENSLAVQVPSLEAEWDTEKNAPLIFADLTVGSHKKVWWRCPAGHSYDSVVKSRVLGTGCSVWKRLTACAKTTVRYPPCRPVHWTRSASRSALTLPNASRTGPRSS